MTSCAPGHGTPRPSNVGRSTCCAPERSAPDRRLLYPKQRPQRQRRVQAPRKIGEPEGTAINKRDLLHDRQTLADRAALLITQRDHTAKGLKLLDDPVLGNAVAVILF